MADQNQMMWRQRVLAQFGDFVLDEDSLDAILNESCRLIANALGADLAKVIEIERESNTGFVRAGVGWRAGIVGHERVSLSERSSEAFAIEKTEPVITNDILRETRFEFPAFLRDHGVIALINVPILLPGRRPWGVLQVDAREARDFDQDDIEFLKTYAMALGPVIDRLRVAAEREQARREVAVREEHLRESAEKYRTLFETIDEGFSILELIDDGHGRTTDFRYLEVNPAFERHTGMSDVVGKLASEVAPDLESSWYESVDRICRSGKSERIERYNITTRRWCAVCMLRVGAQGSRRVCEVFSDITERKLAEAALKQSEERQSFLLELSDALRPLADPAAIQLTAATVLGRHLRANRVAYAEDSGDGTTFIVAPNYVDEAPELAGVFRYADFGSDILENLRAGRNRVQPDLAHDTRLSREERRAFARVGIGASLNVPLVKAGRLVGWLGVNYAAPHAFSEFEIELVQAVGERTWSALERARSEASLRNSESRFQQFANASSGALWIREAATLRMEYVSSAISKVYGVQPDAILGDIKHWAAMILPEDREEALADIERARQGETVLHEFRIQRPDDQSFRWVRNTGFPLLDELGTVQRIGGIFEDVTESKLAVEHQAVLLAELQHRVRNIMAVIRSMALRTADGALDVEHYRSLLEGRLLALARTQVLLTREANAGGSLREIIETELGAQSPRCGQFEVNGPDVRLSPKAVEILTLAFHELVTNALKYGALSVPEGRLRVSWTSAERHGNAWLTLHWAEEGVTPRAAPRRRGFGSDLIEGRIPYELGGSGRFSIEVGGAQCWLEFPLKHGESILETGAPIPALMVGGTLDMRDAPDLSGRHVIVVEDDYYMAGDTAAALRGAGATVLGPCPTEETARELLESGAPTHAVIDLNLGGGGPRLAIARELQQRGIPFIFLTGYDAGVIPSGLETVVRLQKPVSFREIVEAVSRL